MELQCLDFYFYPNGIYRDKQAYNLTTDTYYSDSEEISKHIRLFGTQEEIDKALDDYIEVSGLNVDECFDFDIPSKFEEYKEVYFTKNINTNINKALLINII